jgi:hypothetical protein
MDGFREVRLALDADDLRTLEELAADMSRDPDEVLRGGLRLLGITRALYQLNGVMKPVGDPRDAV